VPLVAAIAKHKFRGECFSCMCWRLSTDAVHCASTLVWAHSPVNQCLYGYSPPVAQAGALASFLRELVIVDCPYADAIMGDLSKCLEVHFQDIASVVPLQAGPSYQPATPMTPTSPNTPHATAFSGPSPRKMPAS
jgi:hypothetical protein